MNRLQALIAEHLDDPFEDCAPDCLYLPNREAHRTWDEWVAFADAVIAIEATLCAERTGEGTSSSNVDTSSER